jgi:hypothetical protein
VGGTARPRKIEASRRSRRRGPACLQGMHNHPGSAAPMRRLPYILLVAMCAVCTAGTASGQGMIRVQGQPFRQACFPDYMRFCRGVLPGRGRIILCLNDHVNELTQPCFQALALRGLASANALKLCRLDYDRICAHTGPGLGRGLACLLDNAPALSPICRDALAKEGLFDDEPDPREFRR